MGAAIGIDSHESLAVAVIDELGKTVDVREVRNNPRSHRDLLRWLQTQGTDRVIGVEGSGAYGAGATRHLLEAGENVKDVPATLTHSERRRGPSQGKSDFRGCGRYRARRCREDSSSHVDGMDGRGSEVAE